MWPHDEPVVMEQLEDRLLMSAGTSDVRTGGTTYTIDAVNQNLGALVYDQTFSGTVSNSNPGRDYNYQFTLAAAIKVGKLRSFKLTMYGMTSDADIDLYVAGTGAILAKAEKWGTKAEKINAKLPAGTYYLRVHVSSFYDGSVVTTPFTIDTCAKP